VGNNFEEAVDDALESMAQQCDGVSLEFEHRLKRSVQKTASRAEEYMETVPEDAEDVYYYVSIRYNIA
jgi:hypothetical protein